MLILTRDVKRGHMLVAEARISLSPRPDLLPGGFNMTGICLHVGNQVYIIHSTA